MFADIALFSLESLTAGSAVAGSGGRGLHGIFIDRHSFGYRSELAQVRPLHCQATVVKALVMQANSCTARPLELRLK